ncbi:MAG TPA: beta-propeller fold lactonase family protein [Gemmataceae bacterium]|nr:beta-propeller fold lactonase family protein [Gemmataceae bacterium]
MTNKHLFRGGLAVLAGIILCTTSFSPAAAQESKLRIIQTNSAGDNIHIINPVTNKVVGEIKGIEAPHGIVVAPDGSRIYVSEQANNTVTVFDGKTLEVTKRIPLSGNPNLIDITPDGRWIYVAIALTWDDLSEFPQVKANPTGGVDVIDTASLQNVKTISLKGGIHDLNVTPDGKYVLAGASRGAKPAANAMFVIDTHTNEVVRTVSMSPSPSPMAVTKNPDGSTDKVYAQLGGFNGFAVLDFATGVRTNQIKLPDVAPDKQNPFGPPAGSHGIAVTADQKTLLVNSRLNNALYAYSLPELKLLGGVPLGGKGAGWLTVTPDDKTAYVANEHTNNVSAIDIKSLKEVALIPVGFAPARNVTWMAP